MANKLVEWYWSNIKYRKYDSEQKRFLVVFERGIRAHREWQEELVELLDLNIKRARCMFDGDYETLVIIEKQIADMGKEWDEGQKELDELDKKLWRQLFFYFLRTHDDDTVSKVWGAPKEDILKFREAIKKLEPKL